jgi:chromosome segregation ATPase
MAFMRRDVNFGLLILIIATLILFSGFTVYYQTNFKNVVTEYNDKLEQLKKVTSDLESEKIKLNQTYQLRVKAERDMKALDTQYRLLSDERDQLENDKNKLQSELLATKATLSETEAKLSQTQTLLSQTQDSLKTANARISSLNSRIDDLKDDIQRLCAKMRDGESDSAC